MTRLPAIVTLGISASKFVEQVKTTNPLLKYFNNAASKTAKPVEDLNKEESTSTEPCTSSDLNESNDNLSILVEAMNNNDIVESKMSSEPTTSKSLNRNNESSLDDVDGNFDECVIIDEDTKQSEANATTSATTASTSSSTTFASNYFQPTNIDNLEESDYLQCQKCLKKILCWFMPEHEDFHYAQELSKELTSKEDANNTVSSNKKRSLTETPLKNSSNQNDNNTDKNSKKTLINNANKSKKPKTENTKSNNIKSIDNYFTKLNNK